MNIEVWAQMFFDDGSVSEGKRYPANILDDGLNEMRQIARKFLSDLGRNEGLLLVWGAGEIHQRYYKLSISSVSTELSFSVSEPLTVLLPEHMMPGH